MFRLFAVKIKNCLHYESKKIVPVVLLCVPVDLPIIQERGHKEHKEGTKTQ
jgi:hypothetical protein